MALVQHASIGWAAALCAIVCNGSFGVPIKGETSRRLDIDPLVFQTYKTIMCLLFSYANVFLLGIPFSFSPWGLVSGLFWVPGGVATVMSIKLAGLSASVAVGNSMVALVSFTWGIFIFQEPVASRWMSCVGVFMMICGFTGMSYFSSSSSKESSSSSSKKENKDESPTSTKVMESPRSLNSLHEALLPKSIDDTKLAEGKKLDDESSSLDDTVSDTDSEDSDFSSSTSTIGSRRSHERSPRRCSSGNAITGSRRRNVDSVSPKVTIRNRKTPPQSQTSRSVLELPNISELPLHSQQPEYSNCPSAATAGRASFVQVSKTSVTIYGAELSRFQAGLAVSAIGGLWGGSVMIPMKLCQANTSGLGYLISFSSGATVVTVALWLLRFLYHLHCHRGSIKNAYQELPSFHLEEMWLPGGISGLLWSTGNLFSILSVHHLGAGVGYCVVQSSMLVGGVWGIFFFGEVSGKATIAKWFCSALVTISGIALLAYEHG